MKPVNKLAVLVLILTSLFYLFSVPVRNCLAEQKELVFENDLRYDVYYMLEDQMQYIANVKITDTVSIEGVVFLVIQSPGITSGKNGYIALSRVRIILPVGSPKPINVSDK